MRIATAILLALMAIASPAQPGMLISLKVGPLLKEAQALIAAKDYKGAQAKLDEAEAVKAYPDDETVISQFRHVIAMQSSRPSQP